MLRKCGLPVFDHKLELRVNIKHVGLGGGVIDGCTGASTAILDITKDVFTGLRTSGVEFRSIGLIPGALELTDRGTGKLFSDGNDVNNIV